VSETSFQANETEYAWELDPWDEKRASRIRVKTFLSAGRTPSSGVSMGVFELPPGALLDPHHHQPPEVYYVVDGEAEVYADGAWRPLRRGDVVYFAADAVHGARNHGPTTCTIVWVFPVDRYEEIEYFAD
jgi:quercetin dioxygenase-like cupin family protein